jgi:RimJ/RimL family protein N-acetyltransferase
MKDLVRNTSITIEIDEPAVSITAETPRLILRSVLPEDVQPYQALFADPEVMAYFGDGKPRLYKDEVSEKKGVVDYAQNLLLNKLNGWCYRWEYGDPFSAFTIIEKGSQNIIGSTIIFNDGLASCIINKDYWNKQYGTEAAIVMCKAILPAISLSQISQSIPEHVVATAHPNNTASCKIIEKAGVQPDPTVTEKEFNGKKVPRKTYKIPTKDLVDEYKQVKGCLPFFELKRKSADHNLPNLVNICGYSLRK